MHPVTHLIGSTTSALVSTLFFLILAVRRDAYMANFFLGSILNAISSKVLKRLLNQDRPLHEAEAKDAALLFADQPELIPTDKGMPSSHATSLGFIALYSSFAMVPYLYHVVTQNSMVLPSVAVGGMGWYVATSLYYRYQRQLHTVPQLAVGLCLGCFNAVVWFGLTAWSGTPLLFPAAGAATSAVSNVSWQEWIQVQLLHHEKFSLGYLLIPAVVGFGVVGSLERRVDFWWKQKKSKEEVGDSNKEQ